MDERTLRGWLGGQPRQTQQPLPGLDMGAMQSVHSAQPSPYGVPSTDADADEVLDAVRNLYARNPGGFPLRTPQSGYPQLPMPAPTEQQLSNARGEAVAMGDEPVESVPSPIDLVQALYGPARYGLSRLMSRGGSSMRMPMRSGASYKPGAPPDELPPLAPMSAEEAAAAKAFTAGPTGPPEPTLGFNPGSFHNYGNGNWGRIFAPYPQNPASRAPLLPSPRQTGSTTAPGRPRAMR